MSVRRIRKQAMRKQRQAVLTRIDHAVMQIIAAFEQLASVIFAELALSVAGGEGVLDGNRTANPQA